MGLSIAYLTPCLLKLTSDVIKKEEITKSYYKSSFAIAIVTWIVVSGLLFGALGVLYPKSSWRVLYLITGIINIASSPLINFL